MAFVHTPHKLLDTVIARFGLKNDAAFAHAVGSSRPTISNVRAKRLPVGASLVLGIHEAFGMPIKEIKALVAA